METGMVSRLKSNNIGVILGLYEDNGKENSNCYNRVYMAGLLGILSQLHLPEFEFPWICPGTFPKQNCSCLAGGYDTQTLRSVFATPAKP